MSSENTSAKSDAAPTEKPRWLSKVVFGFGIASLLSDAGHEAGTAALPVLLTTMAAAPATLGIIEGIADGVVCFAKLFGGSLANRPQWRKPLAVTGYLVTGLSIGLFALSTNWLHILGSRILGWLFRGLRSPSRSAMLADAVPKAALGRAIGFHRAMDTVGAIFGPLLATLLLLRLPLRQVFWVAMVPGVLAAVAFLLLVPGQTTTSREPPPSLLRGMKELPPAFRRFLIAVMSFGIGDFARTLLVLRATQLLPAQDIPGGAVSVAILLFALHHAVAAACAFPVGYLADKMSPRWLLAVGYGLGVVTALLAAFAQPSVVYLAGLFAVAGMVIGIEETIEGVLCARLAPPKLRGTAYGMLAATNGIGDMVASSVVGVVWAAYSPQLAFLLAAVACAVGTVLLVVAVPDE
ncbi:MAG TPA: MFS transporter [Pseudomonadota bacterium]|nr:MFS transporter [Pseudomonadota bacterium]